MNLLSRIVHAIQDLHTELDVYADLPAGCINLDEDSLADIAAEYGAHDPRQVGHNVRSMLDRETDATTRNRE